MNRITIAVAIAVSLCVASVTFGQTSATNTQSAVAIENIIGTIVTSNPTVEGILTNVVVESGAASTLKYPTKLDASISEAYPLFKVSYKAIVETTMFVHSSVLESSGSQDEIGFGFNTFKRTTPSAVKPVVGTVSPAAHHGVFVNVVVGTTKAFKGRFDQSDTGIQAGGYVTF